MSAAVCTAGQRNLASTKRQTLTNANQAPTVSKENDRSDMTANPAPAPRAYAAEGRCKARQNRNSVVSVNGMKRMSALVAVNRTIDGIRLYSTQQVRATRRFVKSAAHRYSGQTPSAPTNMVASDNGSGSRPTIRDITHNRAMGPGGCTFAWSERRG